MRRSSTTIGKFLLLGRTSIGVLTLVLWCGYLQSAFAEPTINATIKVCVVDGQGKAVDVKPTLFNSRAKLEEKEDQCYKAVGVNLDSKLVYFVAAASEDHSTFGFAPLIVRAEDEGKEIRISLKLESHKGPDKTTIEICLNSESGTPLLIKNSKQVSDSDILKAENNHCSRLSVASGKDHKLPLTVGDVKDNTGWLLNTALLFLAVASCALSGLVFLRLRQLPSNTATEETVGSLSTRFENLATETKEIGNRIPQICSFTRQQTPSDEKQGRPSEKEMGAEGTKVDAHKQRPLVPPIAEASQTASATTVNRQDRGRSVAKQQYRSFSQGQSVDHFFVMPTGSSSANNMVEDAGVELREQSSGTYVAFHLIENQNRAWAFPMPETHFTSESFRSLFPDLTAEQYEAGDIEPRALVLLESKLWKLSN